MRLDASGRSCRGMSCSGWRWIGGSEVWRRHALENEEGRFYVVDQRRRSIPVLLSLLISTKTLDQTQKGRPTYPSCIYNALVWQDASQTLHARNIMYDTQRIDRLISAERCTAFVLECNRMTGLFVGRPDRFMLRWVEDYLVRVCDSENSCL